MSESPLPGDWKVVTLNDVAAPVPNAIVDGPFGSSLKLSDYVPDGVPVLQGKNITDDAFRWRDVRFISRRKADELRRSSVRVGDILIVKIGSIGYSAVVGNLNGFDHAIIPANLAKVTPDLSKVELPYLQRWLTSTAAKHYFIRVASKTAQPALSLGKIRALPVPLPPLVEQRRIAEILDKADALRAKRRAALVQLNALKQSIFLEMFGDPGNSSKRWPMGTIADMLDSASYGTSEKAQTAGEFPVLRMNNITRTGEVDLSDLKYMNLEDDKRERCLVRSGDVLFNRTNSADLVGKSAIYRGTQPMAYAGYLIRLRANKNNDAEYVAAFLNTSYMKQHFRTKCKSIIGMANINATEVRALKIGIPPLRTQKAFAAQISRVEKAKSVQRASLAKLDLLFGSLQHRAFRGEL